MLKVDNMDKKTHDKIYPKADIRYWTNTSKGELTFQKVSLSAVWILRNGHYIGTIEPSELRDVADKMYKRVGEK